MKPAPSVLERENTMPVKRRIEFTIGDPRALMRINAKQYSDSTTAVIREYSTNAHDAHVMAGHNDPIEISLPSAMNPFFEVRDHGVGMNEDTFEKIYTQFGISDKTEDVRTNGQMGIGSKSGLAYTTQFTVSSVKDGIKTEAKVIREPDWTLVLDILSEDFTDEPNGTVIRMEVHNVDEFRQKAHDFFKFWLPGRVLIDGQPSVHHVGEKIADNLYYSKDWMTSYVVMANVAYRIANPAALFRESRLSNLHFVAYVDDLADQFGNAPIDFTPSREDLEYSDLTKNTLQGVISNFERDLRSTAQAEIDKAKTHAEAYTAWAKWKDTLQANLFGDLSFKGDSFKSDFAVVGRKYSINSSRGSQAIRDWGVEACPRTVFITNFRVQASAEVRRKVKAYCDMTWPDAQISYYVFAADDTLDSPWVDWKSQMVVEWADLKKALPKSARQSVYNPQWRVKGSWDYFTKDGKSFEEPVPENKTLAWISVYDSKRYSVKEFLSTLGSDAVVLIVPMNRLAKLKREHPEIEHFPSWARSNVETDGAKLLSADAKKIFGIDGTKINRLDTSRINDPEFGAVQSLMSRRDLMLAEYNRHKRLANLGGLGYNSFKEYVPGTDRVSLFDSYPLLRNAEVCDDLYLYINAKTESEKSK